MSGQFNSRVVVANEVKLSASSKYGILSVGTTATKVDLGGSETTMTIACPEGQDVLYVGLDNTVSSTNYFKHLIEGEMIGITVDTSDPPEIWVIGTTASDGVAVLEGVVS